MTSQENSFHQELSRMGDNISVKEVKRLAFLYLGDSRKIDDWHDLISELLHQKKISNCERDLIKLRNYLKPSLREGTERSTLDSVQCEVNSEEDSGMVHVPRCNAPSQLKLPPKQAEEIHLEKTLNVEDLESYDSTVAENIKDVQTYDTEHTLPDEEKEEHKNYVDRVDECAKKSPDPQTKVGAVIVSKENQVIGEGYNRMPRGCEGRLPWSDNDPSEPLDKGKHPYVVYAIPAAVLDAVKQGYYEKLRGATVYVSFFPSNTCAQLILEVGISRVIYTTKKFSKTYFRTAAQRILNSDVKCRYYSKP